MKLEQIITGKLEKLLETSPVSFEELVTKSREDIEKGKQRKWLSKKTMDELMRLGLATSAVIPDVVVQTVLGNVRGRGTQLFVKEAGEK